MLWRREPTRDAVMRTKRIEPLDSLRGIAAFIVVICHCMIAFPGMERVYRYEDVSGWAWLVSYTPLHLFWAGQEAVIVFFVLSGYVLSLPYWQGSGLPAGRFILKRFLRLYPPYFAAMVMAFTLMSLIAARPVAFSDAITSHWVQPISWDLVRDHLFMILSPSLYIVNGPVWSLSVEMQASIIFPLIVAALSYFRWWALLVAVLLSASQRFFPLPLSLFYLWLFVLGAYAAMNQAAIHGVLGRLSAVWQWLLLSAALLLLIARWLLPHVMGLAPLLTGLGAFGVVMACRHFSILSNVLSHAALVWLGGISFSLYLVHFPVQMALMSLLSGHVPSWAILLLDIPAALLVATFFHRCIEVPSIALSRIVRKPAASPARV